MEKKRVSPIATMAVFSLAFIAMGFSIVTPAMGTLIEYWNARGVSTTNVYLISTIPTLFMVPFTVISGLIVGRKVKYRTMALLGSALFVLGGILPAIFSDSWALMVFSRALFGVGLGLFTPLGNALILGLYERKTAASYLGYGTLIMNLGGVVMQYLGGILAGVSWSTTFWAYLIGILAFVLCLFLPEPEIAPTPAGKVKEKMSPLIWITAAAFFLLNLGSYPLMMNLSTLFVVKGAGDAVVAATALSLYTVAGMVGGAIFGKVFQKISRFIVPAGFLIGALGIYLVYIGPNAVVMSTGTALMGFGLALVMPAFFAFIGLWTSDSTTALATSINLGLMNLSGFASSYYLLLFGDGYLYNEFIGAIVIWVVLAAFFIIWNPIKHARKDDTPETVPETQ